MHFSKNDNKGKRKFNFNKPCDRAKKDNIFQAKVKEIKAEKEIKKRIKALKLPKSPKSHVVKLSDLDDSIISTVIIHDDDSEYGWGREYNFNKTCGRTKKEEPKKIVRIIGDTVNLTAKVFLSCIKKFLKRSGNEKISKKNKEDILKLRIKEIVNSPNQATVIKSDIIDKYYNEIEENIEYVVNGKVQIDSSEIYEGAILIL